MMGLSCAGRRGEPGGGARGGARGHAACLDEGEDEAAIGAEEKDEGHAGHQR